MALFDRLFGFTINRKKESAAEKRNKPKFVFPDKGDGAAIIEGYGAAGGHRVFMLDVEGVFRSEHTLITKYRDMLTHPEVNRAVNQIINDMITIEPGKPAASVVLDQMDGVGDKTKEKITEAFHEVVKLLDFNDKAYSIAKRFYVDGRLYYFVSVDESSPKKGIQELIYLDPRQIKKIREITRTPDRETGVEKIEVSREYYIYSPSGATDIDDPSNGNGSGGFGGTHTSFDNGSSMSVFAGSASTFNPLMGQINLTLDSVAAVHVDNPDKNSRMILSYLHPAIRPLNLLRMIEDAIVIYRTARAPERRVFYVDCGNMPVRKQEEYLKSVMDTFRNKTTYDAVTGEIRDDKRFLSMMEDFWLPRSEGSRGTEVDTLPGGQNLGEIDDIEYFQRKLYESLEVPISRMNRDKSFSLGRTSEITQDELSFSKFITRLRVEFSGLFKEILKRQVILKGILTEEEWEEHCSDIYIDFNQDSFFTEFKHADLMRERLGLLRDMEQYIGTFFTKKEVFTDVLMKTEEEIEQTLKQIETEKREGDTLTSTDDDGDFGDDLEPDRSPSVQDDEDYKYSEDDSEELDQEFDKEFQDE